MGNEVRGLLRVILDEINVSLKTIFENKKNKDSSKFYRCSKEDQTWTYDNAIIDLLGGIDIKKARQIQQALFAFFHVFNSATNYFTIIDEVAGVGNPDDNE